MRFLYDMLRLPKHVFQASIAFGVNERPLTDIALCGM